VKLTEKVLALHDGIRQVLVLEDRSGMFIVTEKATKNGASSTPYTLNGTVENGALAPALILGAAAQFGENPASLKLVGILYRDEGIMLTYIDESKVLEICTEPSSLYDGMRVVNEALPGLVKELEIGGKTEGAIKSASEAEDIARNYVVKTRNATRVFIKAVTRRAADNRWEIQGVYSPSRLSRSKDFQVELDAEDGAINSFLSSPSSSGALFAAMLIALLAGLGVLAWLLYSNLLRR
jgi:hypothetical protein